MERSAKARGLLAHQPPGAGMERRPQHEIPRAELPWCGPSAHVHLEHLLVVIEQQAAAIGFLSSVVATRTTLRAIFRLLSMRDPAATPTCIF